MASCVYCGNSKAKITREHLWPTALHSRLQNARQQSRNYFWLARLEKSIASEPAINDVCSSCNNGPLSELDAYICWVWDTQLRTIRQRGEEIGFEYDYDLLSRWLLKLCFNSARVHKNDPQVFKDYIEYILNGEPAPANFRLFLQVVPPGYIPYDDVADLPAGATRIYEPQSHRIGFYFFKDSKGRQKLLRAVHLRSFTFLIAFFYPTASDKEIRTFVESLTAHRPEVRLLQSGSRTITAVCSGADAWQSFRRSRTKLTFGHWRDSEHDA